MSQPGQHKLYSTEYKVAAADSGSAMPARHHRPDRQCLLLSMHGSPDSWPSSAMRQLPKRYVTPLNKEWEPQSGANVRLMWRNTMRHELAVQSSCVAPESKTRGKTHVHTSNSSVVWVDISDCDQELAAAHISGKQCGRGELKPATLLLSLSSLDGTQLGHKCTQVLCRHVCWCGTSHTPPGTALSFDQL